MKIFCIYKAEQLPRSEIGIIAQQLKLRFLQTRDYYLIQSSQRPHNVGINIIVSISFSTRKLYLLTFLKTNTKYPWAERLSTSSTQGTDTTPVLMRCERKPARPRRAAGNTWSLRLNLGKGVDRPAPVPSRWSLLEAGTNPLAASSWAHQTPGVPVLRKCSPAGPGDSHSSVQ